MCTIQPLAELQDWHWRFGQTPDFAIHLETRFDWGTLDVHLHTEKSVMQRAVVFSDCLYPALIESFQQRLAGVAYSPAGVQQAMIAVRGDMVAAGLSDTVDVMVTQFGQWLTNEIK
jgi:lipoate-protein ligase A